MQLKLRVYVLCFCSDLQIGRHEEDTEINATEELRTGAWSPTCSKVRYLFVLKNHC